MPHQPRPESAAPRPHLLLEAGEAAFTQRAIAAGVDAAAILEAGLCSGYQVIERPSMFAHGEEIPLTSGMSRSVNPSKTTPRIGKATPVVPRPEKPFNHRFLRAVRVIHAHLLTRSLDVLHLAAARAQGCTVFVSADDRELAAAKATGLKASISSTPGLAQQRR